GAERFARAMGHAYYDPITPDRLADWTRKKKEFENKSSGLTLKVRRFLQAHPEYAGGTIGVVAMDRHGVLCSATSTGGMTLKLVGRVGDTPLPGCGTYASRYSAASATGTGEFIIRSMACRQISDNVSKGMSLQRATDSVLDQLSRDFNADAGIIAIDAHGVPYANHLSADMPHAWFASNGQIVARMRVPK
ncbi:MAG: isoaspartyl peptidase/L-asparaginase, partial [Betaproteobacteria bacterium]|nr:isoaspartyl peptidase/L-asparaginase [Betaproteobacteria bacterium]